MTDEKRNAMVLEVYPLVKIIVADFCRRRGCQFMYDDLLQRSQFVVMAATGKFDPKIAKWTTYAGDSVRFALRTAIRKEKKHQHAPMEFPDGSQVDIGDPDATEGVRGVQDGEETALLLARLNPQQRQVIKWSFWESLTYEIIALRMGLSKQRVEQIAAQAMAIMRATEAPPSKMPEWAKDVGPSRLTYGERAVWTAYQINQCHKHIAAKLNITTKQVDNALQRIRRKAQNK